MFSNLKRWALGVYHGLRRKHLQSYLDEFVFRFNRRCARHAAFRSLLGSVVARKPTTCTGSNGISLFYNVDVLGGKRISNQVVQYSWNVAAGASAKGTLDCVSAWYTDFRKDLPRIDVPTLVIHGDADRILPIAATGSRTQEAVKGSRLVVVEGGPHGVTWMTHADKVNPELVDFLG
jgi:non-heme chloroperoxidase